jgi:hypothetical protein
MSFLWQRKLWWLIPMVLVLLVFGGLMGHRPELGPRPVYLHPVLKNYA